MKHPLFSSVGGDVPANIALVNNPAATTDPGATDDASDGYEVGSTWVNVSTRRAFICVDPTAGAAVWVASGAGSQGQLVAPAATSATGSGSTALVQGGAGGATSGAGGPANVKGGDATAGNSNGGSVVLQGGAKQGTGIDGVLIERSIKLVKQGAPAAKTVSATLTAAEVLAGIVTVNQAGGAASAQQLPLATDLDAAIPDSAAGDAFDFSVINTSTVDAEDASVTTNTGWTLVGSMDVPAYSAAGSLNASGRFRARKTATGAWSLYRIA